MSISTGKTARWLTFTKCRTYATLLSSFIGKEMIGVTLLSCRCNKTDERAVATNPGKEVFASGAGW
jgi:hypothetical protein